MISGPHPDEVEGPVKQAVELFVWEVDERTDHFW